MDTRKENRDREKRMKGRDIAMWEGTYGDMGRQKFELGYKEGKMGYRKRK